MKLLDVAEFYCPQGGGVRTYIDQKLAAGKRLGWETVIVAPGPENREEARDGGKVIWVKAPRIPFDPRYHQFVSYTGIHAAIDQERPDVLEASSPWLGGWAVARWQGSDCVKSFFLHNDPVAAYPQALFGDWLGMERVDRMFGWFWRYMRSLRDHFDTMVVSSEWIADRLHKYAVDRPRVVGFGVDASLFSPDLKSGEARREMLAACGFDDPETPLLIAVSRHHPEKKIGTMLRAFEKASRQRPMALYLIGDGLHRKNVERKAAPINGVCVAGAIQDRDRLARYLASADVFLHGCGFETFGLVVAEALCSGLPLVVPNTGGAAELARPSYAETYPTGNVPAAADAILRILDRDLPTLHREAALAGQRIRSPQRHFQDLFDYYGNLVRQPARMPTPAVPDTVWAGGISANDAAPVQIQPAGCLHPDREDARPAGPRRRAKARW